MIQQVSSSAARLYPVLLCFPSQRKIARKCKASGKTGLPVKWINGSFKATLFFAFIFSLHGGKVIGKCEDRLIINLQIKRNCHSSTAMFYSVFFFSLSLPLKKNN